MSDKASSTEWSQLTCKELLNPSEETKPRVLEFQKKLAAYAPNATPAQPLDSVRDVINVIHTASIEGGHGGVFCSHFSPDSKQWL